MADKKEHFNDLYSRTDKFVVQEFNERFGNTPEDRRKVMNQRMDEIAERFKTGGFVGPNEQPIPPLVKPNEQKS